MTNRQTMVDKALYKNIEIEQHNPAIYKISGFRETGQNNRKTTFYLQILQINNIFKPTVISS